MYGIIFNVYYNNYLSKSYFIEFFINPNRFKF